MLWCIGGNRHTMNLIIPGCKIHHKQRIIATIEKKLTKHGKDAHFD